MCHFKEIDLGLKNIISNFGVPNLLFGMLKVVLSEPPFGINRTNTARTPSFFVSGFENILFSRPSYACSENYLHVV